MQEIDCAGVETSPIAIQTVLTTLRRHGFRLGPDAAGCSKAGPAMIFGEAAPERGVMCFVRRRGSGTRVTTLPEGQLRLANVSCMVLGEGEAARKDVARLEAVFAELEKTLR